MIRLLIVFLFSCSLWGNESLENATIAFYAVHMPTGKVLLSENGKKSLIPASCMKIITTAAALHVLGPKTFFQTELAYDGFIDKEGILQGNLYIIGGGDPCLGSSRVSGSLSAKSQLRTWVEEIRKLGVKQIVGQVLGDASLWEESRAIPSWQWEDLGNYYGAGASALSFHENSYFLWLKPGKEVGDSVEVLSLDPVVPSMVLRNVLKTGLPGSGDCAVIYGSEIAAFQEVRGTIPCGVDRFLIKGSVPNPSRWVSDLLALELKEVGVAIEGKELLSQKKTTIHITHSPCVAEIIHETNQISMNLYAEHLLKKMGQGETLAGVRVVSDFLKAQGVDLRGFQMADGSGLSRKNAVTAEQLVSILLKIKQSEFFSFFLESLPLQRDEIRAKSGSMDLVKSYAGYVGDIAFAIMINQGLDRNSMNKEVECFFKRLLLLHNQSHEDSLSKGWEN